MAVAPNPCHNARAMKTLLLLAMIIVFQGRPSVKIAEGGLGRAPETLSERNADYFECVISKVGDDYFWASRENARLQRVDAGAFTTFTALDGSGYVRVTKKEKKAAASLVGKTEARFDYVEHLLVGLRSFTYYGRERQPFPAEKSRPGGRL